MRHAWGDPAGRGQSGWVPEGDVVRRTAQRLHAALAGRTLVTSDLRWPSLATVDLRGREVLEVASAGKHLLARVEGGLTLHSHLRMEGQWRVHRTDAAATRRGALDGGVRADPGERRVDGGRPPAGDARPRAHRPGGRPRRAPRARRPRTGLGRRRGQPGGCSRRLAARWARHCSTSGCWPASAPSTCARCASCAASRPGRRPARCGTRRASSPSCTRSCGRTPSASSRARPETSARGGSSTSTPAPGSPAAGAGRRSASR